MRNDPIFVKPGSPALPEDVDGPGTGGLFVYPREFSAYRMVAQILVEYAEQGFPVLVVDRGDDPSRGVLSVLASIFNAKGPGDLKLLALPIPLFIRDAGANIESTLRKVVVAYNSAFDEQDDHACDMGDVSGVLYVMTYPNEDARVFEAPHGLAVDSGGRYVREH